MMLLTSNFFGRELAYGDVLTECVEISVDIGQIWRSRKKFRSHFLAKNQIFFSSFFSNERIFMGNRQTQKIFSEMVLADKIGHFSYVGHENRLKNDGAVSKNIFKF